MPDWDNTPPGVKDLSSPGDNTAPTAITVGADPTGAAAVPITDGPLLPHDIEAFAGTTVPFDLTVTLGAAGEPFTDFAGWLLVFTLGAVVKTSANGAISLGGNSAYWELSAADLAAFSTGTKHPWSLAATSPLDQTTLMAIGTLKLNPLP